MKYALAHITKSAPARLDLLDAAQGIGMATALSLASDHLSFFAIGIPSNALARAMAGAAARSSAEIDREPRTVAIVVYYNLSAMDGRASFYVLDEVTEYPDWRVERQPEPEQYDGVPADTM